MNGLIDSYLTGNQLTSKSSVEAYINVLETGCRCIERKFSLFEPIILYYLVKKAGWLSG